VCESDGTVLGYAYAGKFHTRAAYQWTVEVTVYVHPDHHGQGVGLGLYASLLACLEVQGFCTAVGAIALPNRASVGLHERLGFTAAARLHAVGYKHGRWHDVGWWERTLRVLRPSPPPPRVLRSVLRTRRWQRALQSGMSMLRVERRR